MKNKNKSIFEMVLSSVSKLSWLKEPLEHFIHNKENDHEFIEPSYDEELNLLRNMNEQDFEQLIHEIFKQRGYTISANNEDQDNEIDLVLLMDNQKTYVQYKEWKEDEIDVKSVAKIYVLMNENNVRHGMIITSGNFSPEAMDVALGKTVLLINGSDLSQMIYSLSQISEEDRVEEIETPLVEEMPELEPLCPICSQKMIKRTAKKGKNAGNTFWGCSQFPNCRGVVSNN